MNNTSFTETTILIPVDDSNISTSPSFPPEEEQEPYEGKMWGAAPYDQQRRIENLLLSWNELVVPIPNAVSAKHSISYVSLSPGCVINGQIGCCNKHKIMGEFDGTPCEGPNHQAIPRFMVHAEADRLSFSSRQVEPPPPPSAQPFPPPIFEVQDPVLLGFSLRDVLRDEDDARYHEGVTFDHVWRNDLARMAWLIMKPITLTDQFFRRHCLDFSEAVRTFKPKLVEDVPIHFFFPTLQSSFMELRTTIYRYMVRTLIDIGEWPYMMPPRALVADRQIGWISLDDQ